MSDEAAKTPVAPGAGACACALVVTARARLAADTINAKATRDMQRSSARATTNFNITWRGKTRARRPASASGFVGQHLRHGGSESEVRGQDLASCAFSPGRHAR